MATKSQTRLYAAYVVVGAVWCAVDATRLIRTILAERRIGKLTQRVRVEGTGSAGRITDRLFSGTAKEVAQRLDDSLRRDYAKPE